MGPGATCVTIVLIVVMLHVIMYIDLMLGVMMNVITLSDNTLCPFMLRVIMLSCVTQTALMLCLHHDKCRYADYNYAANH